MADTRPLPWLFLDVDGPLNAYDRSGPSPSGFSDFREVRARGFTLQLSAQMGGRLAALPVEIAWATTWSPFVDDAVASAIGLPKGLRVAATPPEDDDPLAVTNWKLVQVRELLESDPRPFIWVDDVALDEPGPDGTTPRRWAETLNLKSLLLAPSPREGLTSLDIDAIEAWLDQLR